MKAAIVTFQGAENYGAVLQAYAMSKWLSKQGIEPEIINYDSRIYSKYKLFRTFRYKKQPIVLLVDLLAYPGKSKRTKNFADFRKNYLPLTKKAYKTSDELKEIEDSYDYYFCGSDQIWNPEITWGVDGVYFLDFVKNSEKKIAFSPSVAVSSLPDETILKMEELISTFHAISVREQSGADLLQPYCDKPISVTSDPVFLLDPDDYLPICDSTHNDGAVFLYVVGPAREYRGVISYAEKIAKEKNLKLYYLVDGDKTLFHIHGKNIYGCNPAAFLRLIKESDYVISNSFHATAFSLIFGKQFATFAKKGTSSRMNNLLDAVGLKDRMYSGDGSFDIDKPIDTAALRALLASYREGSEQYLFSALGKGAVSTTRMQEEIRSSLAKRNALKAWAEEQKDNYYIAVHNNEETRRKSRSGGVFTALSDLIIDNGGVVYGCRMQNHTTAVHSRATTKEERDSFRGSKYIQSEMKDCYSNVKDDLQNGTEVLFSGTGCQVAGLLSYLNATRTNTDNLITMDIVCHGVPSPLVWREYLSWMKRKYGNSLTEIDFRDKTHYGWKSHFETLIINGKLRTTSVFRILFYKHHILRPSCYECHFANQHRCSDITIGDAWGVQTADPDWNDNKGCSLVIVNTDKGRKLFEAAQEAVHSKKVEAEKYLQPNLIAPSKRPTDRNEFWKTFDSKGFEAVAARFGMPTKKGMIKDKLILTASALHMRNVVKKLG